MTLGSGCGSKTLVRVGAGNLKSVVVFVFLGIASYMTLKGLFGIWRTSWFDPVALNAWARTDLDRWNTEELCSQLAAKTTSQRRPPLALRRVVTKPGSFFRLSGSVDSPF